MEIRIRPEIEMLVKQDVERGPYQSVDEFVECAISMLHEQEAWLAQNRSGIARKIEEAYAAAESGELLAPTAARSRLNEIKHSHKTSR